MYYEKRESSYANYFSVNHRNTCSEVACFVRKHSRFRENILTIFQTDILMSFKRKTIASFWVLKNHTHPFAMRKSSVMSAIFCAIEFKSCCIFSGYSYFEPLIIFTAFPIYLRLYVADYYYWACTLGLILSFQVAGY